MSAFSGRALGLGLAASIAAVPASLACPIERSRYHDNGNVASIEFRPTGQSAAVTNTFRMLVGSVAFDGVVLWTQGIARPNGVLSYQCPDGDVTGPELDACTLWQGVIYTSDAAGKIGLLPAEGTEAPQTLVLADLAYGMTRSASYAANRFSQSPGDVFTLEGCRE